MNETKKAVCPKCGKEAQCFFIRHFTESVFLKDEYAAHCVCGWRETKRLHAGNHVGNRDFPVKTTCPFCGRPPGEHTHGFSSAEISRMMDERRDGETGRLRAPPSMAEIPPAERLVELAEKLTMGGPPAVKLTAEPATADVPDLFENLPAMAEPEPQAAPAAQELVPLPEKKPAPPGNAPVAPTPAASPKKPRGARKIVTASDILKLMLVFTICAALLMGGVAFFAIQAWNQNATFEEAFHAAWIMATIAAVVFAASSWFIVRDFRKRFEKPRSKS